MDTRTSLQQLIGSYVLRLSPHIESQWICSTDSPEQLTQTCSVRLWWCKASYILTTQANESFINLSSYYFTVKSDSNNDIETSFSWLPAPLHAVFIHFFGSKSFSAKVFKSCLKQAIHENDVTYYVFLNFRKEVQNWSFL